MARPLRIEYEGAFYHVTSRGNRGEPIFSDNRDRGHFLDVLRSAKKRFGFIIHAFVLMTNHYHLLLETPGANLSSILHHINTSYTQWFNRRHQRIGHVLQGRYKSILVSKDEYYLELVRYIHINPLRAGIVDSIDAYRWSSHFAIINDRAADEWRDFYNRNNVLCYFGRRKRKAIDAYRAFVLAGQKLKRDDVFKGLSCGYILGENSFVEWVLHNFVDVDRIDKEIAGSKGFKRGFDYNEVLSAISLIYNTNRKEIITVKRGCTARNEARMLAIYLLARHSSMTQRSVAKLFGGVSDVSISRSAKLCEQQMKTNKKLRNNYKELMKILKIY